MATMFQHAIVPDPRHCHRRSVTARRLHPRPNGARRLGTACDLVACTASDPLMLSRRRMISGRASGERPVPGGACGRSRRAAVRGGGRRYSERRDCRESTSGKGGRRGASPGGAAAGRPGTPLPESQGKDRGRPRRQGALAPTPRKPEVAGYLGTPPPDARGASPPGAGARPAGTPEAPPPETENIGVASSGRAAPANRRADAGSPRRATPRKTGASTRRPDARHPRKPECRSARGWPPGGRVPAVVTSGRAGGTWRGRSRAAAPRPEAACPRGCPAGHRPWAPPPEPRRKRPCRGPPCAGRR